MMLIQIYWITKCKSSNKKTLKNMTVKKFKHNVAHI